MSSFTRHNNSPAMDKSWFQDTKTGNEKQAHYFVQIRKLQDELIHREQHNLVNAMERLKQLTYPRKRPVIRIFDANPSSDPPSVQNFPARNLNLRKQAKHKVIQGKEQSEIKPLSGKPLINKPSHKKQASCYHHFFVMPPLLSDRDIAKIVHNVNTTFPSEPSTYLLQPHLPSIPNVGRKTTFVVDNRLRLLTLAESEFCDPKEGSVSGMRKHLHTGKSQRGKKSPSSKSRSDDHASSENINKTGKKNILTFDVDPNDPSLFSHCAGSKNEEEHYEMTPLPPPNSRPSSSKSRASHRGVGEVIQQLDHQEADTSKASDTDYMYDENITAKNTITASTNEDNVAAKEKEMSKVDTEVNTTADDHQLPDTHTQDLSSNLVAVEHKQDVSDQVIDSEGAVNIAQVTVTIPSKPVSVEEGETDHGY